MTVLIVDNYDSFVFNLARYVNKLGFETLIKRNDALSVADIKIISPSHIILSPGPCSPKEAGICLELIQELHNVIPMLGVCLGHQAIAQAFGGTVSRAKYPMHGKASLISHKQQGIFSKFKTPLTVGRYHSLIVEENNFPDVLEVTALSDKGEVMALSHRQYPVYGLQFHPESILTGFGYELLQVFLE